MVKDAIKNKSKRISVRFDRYPKIWKALFDAADDNCRRLNDEIVYCVKEQLKFECEVEKWEKENDSTK